MAHALEPPITQASHRLNWLVHLVTWNVPKHARRTTINTLINPEKAGGIFALTVSDGRMDLAEKLFNAGASISAHSTDNGDTALHYAVRNSDKTAVKFLIAHNASLTAVNKDNQTPIELACQIDWEIAQLLLDANSGKKLTAQEIENLHYEQALLTAIKSGNYALTELLLKHGAPCNSWNTIDGNIALHVAVKECEWRLDIVTLLLNYGANPNQRNAYGKTTHDYARQLHHKACAQRLSSLDLCISPERISIVSDHVTEMFDNLLDNRYAINKLPFIIAELNICERSILENDLQALSARHQQLTLSPSGGRRVPDNEDQA